MADFLVNSLGLAEWLAWTITAAVAAVLGDEPAALTDAAPVAGE